MASFGEEFNKGFQESRFDEWYQGADRTTKMREIGVEVVGALGGPCVAIIEAVKAAGRTLIK